MAYLLVLGGFIALLFGGDYLVRGAVAAAQRLGISPMVIGLTLVGFGTSMPELATSVQAALAGSPGIALGNVIGSNIANILLILGVAALLLPIAVSRDTFRRDGGVLVAATALCLVLAATGTLLRWHGVVFLIGLAGFLWLAFHTDGGDAAEPDPLAGIETSPPTSIGRALLQFVGGLAVVLLGARLLVLGAVQIATDWGVSETVIGLTVVAIGTSLPELVTSAVAARRGQSDVAFGNVIGSNIFNILGILGVTALVSPLPVPPEMLALDLWVMAVATLLLVVVAVTSWRITRAEGAGLVTLYAVYVAFLIA